MHHLSVDLETFSDIDIKKAGLFKYVQSPNFQILLFAFSLNYGPVQIVDLARGEVLPNEIVYALRDPNTVKHAYNATFEWYCLNKFYFSPIEQWQCTEIHGLYCGYPGKLSAINDAMGIPEDKKKLGTGMALIRTFCIPCKPTATNGHRTRTLPHHEPQKWELFKTYCKQDVAAEMEVEKRLAAFPVPEREWRNWILDTMINSRGAAVDTELVESALYCNEVSTNQLMAEAVQISGLDNPKSVKQLTEWLEEEINGETDDETAAGRDAADADNGIPQRTEIANLQKGTVKELLEKVESEKARRMLEIRQELSKTSVKKYTAMQTAVCADGRIRGLLQFYGANRTGRDAGRLVQVQNLPQNHLPALDLARQLVKQRRIDDIRMIYGNVPDTLSQLIRTAFVAKPGSVLIPADFSAIEARIIAWLADEKWRMDVFASHGKIYEASASSMFGVPIESIDKKSPLRQRGKISELALGFQGAVGALLSMRKSQGISEEEFPESEMPDTVKRWRAANKRIVDLWYKVENAAIEVVKTCQPVNVRGLLFARECDFQNNQEFFTITLFSGRKLFYVKPFLQTNERGREALHYWGLDQTTKKWGILPTYGGKLVENIVQAIARDILFENLQRIDRAGYGTVFHVHDEDVIEIPEALVDLKRICDIMGQPIPWAPGLLLRADGFISKYYKKDD